MTEVFQVRMADSATQDIRSIRDYVYANGSPDIADKLLDKIFDRVESLEKFPRRGAIIPGLEANADELRQFLVGVYRGIYVIEDDIVLIIAVLDGRRDILPLLERRLLTRPD